jgi:acetylornithine/succinyldiaminopimelate/putrescine aminotransferase
MDIVKNEKRVKRADGLFVWLDDGKPPIVDLVQGYSTTNWGHRHPRIIEAAFAALQDVDHITGFLDPLHESVAYRLAQGVGIPGGEVYFDVGGAQISRLAIHVAMLATGRSQIMCLDGCFHGHGCAGERLSESFLVPLAQNPICTKTVVMEVGLRSRLDEIRRGECAAAIVEPIQGAAGFQKVPGEWLREVAKACADSGTLLIADEIQVGLGRTGFFTAIEEAKVSADIYLFGKALGGGIYPVSAMVARPGVIPRERSEQIGLGSTFTNNQIGIRVANTVLDLLDESLLCKDISSKGRKFCKAIQTEMKSNEMMRIRSYGLAVAIDCDTPECAKRFWEEAFRRRIYCHVSGVRKDIVKMFPPLNTSMEELLEIGGRIGMIMQLVY